MNTLKSMIFAVTLCFLAGVTTQVVADVEIPEEWLGVWEMDFSIYDCATNALIFSSTSLDTICPGAVFEDPDPSSNPVECTGTADATSYTTHCEGSEEVSPGCIANFVYDVQGTRNGNSYSSTATMTTTFTGCADIPDQCTRTEITGTRISDYSEPCEALPVENQPWATVKSLYR